MQGHGSRHTGFPQSVSSHLWAPQAPLPSQCHSQCRRGEATAHQNKTVIAPNPTGPPRCLAKWPKLPSRVTTACALWPQTTRALLSFGMQSRCALHDTHPSLLSCPDSSWPSPSVRPPPTHSSVPALQSPQGGLFPVPPVPRPTPCLGFGTRRVSGKHLKEQRRTRTGRGAGLTQGTGGMLCGRPRKQR